MSDPFGLSESELVVACERAIKGGPPLSAEEYGSMVKDCLRGLQDAGFSADIWRALIKEIQENPDWTMDLLFHQKRKQTVKLLENVFVIAWALSKLEELEAQ